MATKLHPTKNDLPSKTRSDVVDLLNESVATASDLHSQAKQAHWNVKGKQFIALHELFDKVAGAVDGFVDDLAERAVALGGTAHGTVRVAAKNSGLGEYPAGIVDGADHVKALSTALADFGKHVRKAIDKADKLGDAGTADLYTGISRETDKLLWFVESHGIGAK